MPGFRPTSRCCRNLNSHARRVAGRCATETVGLVLSCLFFDIFGMGDYRYFRGRSCLASNPHDRLSLDSTALSINASLHGYAPTHGCSSTSALVQTSSPRKRFAVRPSHRRHRHESCRPALIFRSSTACTRHPVGLVRKYRRCHGARLPMYSRGMFAPR